MLVTIGGDADPAALGALPANAHVERWVPQSAVMPHAAAMVGHGGSGSTLAALAAGVPLALVEAEVVSTSTRWRMPSEYVFTRSSARAARGRTSAARTVLRPRLIRSDEISRT